MADDNEALRHDPRDVYALANPGLLPVTRGKVRPATADWAAARRLDPAIGTYLITLFARPSHSNKIALGEDYPCIPLVS